MGDGRVSVEDLAWFDNAQWGEGGIPVALPGVGAAAPVTLGALTGSATATVRVTANGAVTFDDLTGASTATVLVSAVGAVTLGALTGTATAVIGVTANGAVTLGALTGSATATVRVTANGAVTLGTLVSTSTDVVPSAPAFACLSAAWATGPWGFLGWGGDNETAPGGPIPFLSTFDIYCAGPCGPIAQLLTYDEVDAQSGAEQFLVDGYTLDQMVRGGGTYSANEAEIIVNKAVPAVFTLEFTVSFANLPNNFNDLIYSHVYIGVSDAAGACAGLFFSKAGLLYTGCVHYDGVQLVLDTPIQPLENSQVLVSEDTYWTIRIASSFDTGTTYLYITETSEVLESGHKLRYVLPAIPSSSAVVVPPDRTLILVRGTVSSPAWVSFDSLCLASGLLIPNIAPVADPGTDQALQLCGVLQLDGSKSFDPEGSTLLYQWRLIDAPLPSQYALIGADGTTHPGIPPTGFADRFYSAELAILDAADPILSGDVVVIQGTPHTIQNTGTDGDGFFVRVGGFVLPDDFVGVIFTFLRQNGLNTSTSLKPTFYPDVAGIYKFDLTVFDGGLFSTAESVVVNVTESPVARGCTPDLSFIWGYLSDFWKIVEDTERIDVFWQGLAQVAAAELLNLWQTDYSKSLRDVPRTFQRRWLHYDMLMQQSPALLELTTVRAVFAGVESTALALTGVTGVSGTHLDVQLASWATPIIINFTGADPYTAADIQAVVRSALARFDARVLVQLLPQRSSPNGRLRIDAPFAFTILPSSTFPFFTSGARNGQPAGTAGAALGERVYRVERSLQSLDIKANDFLCINGTAYRIDRVLDDATDPFPFQRIVLLDALPLLSGATWAISGTATSRDLDFWAGLCEQSDEVTFEVLRLADQRLIDVVSVVTAASSAVVRSLPCDASPIGLYLADTTKYAVFLKSVRRRRFVPVDPLIVDVPYLQEKIVSKDDTQVLRRNVDYFLEVFREQPCLRFITPIPHDAGGPDVWDGAPPPDQLWAETSYLDNRPRIEQNFGIPASFTLDDLAQLPANVDYLSSVRGLWYAYFTGPTVFNLRVGVQILLGLPFAEEAGTITEIRNDFSDAMGRILIQDLANATITRSYTFPRTLSLEPNPATGAVYKVGDVAKQFAPLVTGVDVIDYVKDPTWFVGFLNQGAFFEVEKFFKFLVRVDVAAFNLSALLFVQSFIRRIKPTYTFPMFVVRADVAETEISVTDDVSASGSLYLYGGIHNKPHVHGVTPMLDDPRAAGGGWRAAFDQNNDPDTAPTYPTPEVPISWAYDKKYLAPEDAIVGSFEQVLGAPTAPQFDMAFLRFDRPAVDGEGLAFAIGAAEHVEAAPGKQLGPLQLAPASLTWNYCIVEARIHEEATPSTFWLVIKQNGTTVDTIPVTLTNGDSVQVLPTSFAVTIGDEIEVFLLSSTASAVRTYIQKLMVTLAHAVPWAFDTNLSAGTYRGYREL